MADTDLLNAAEGSAALSAPGLDTTDVAAAITAVSRRIDQFAGPVVQRTITGAVIETPITDARVLELPFWPVASVTSVAEYNTAGTLTALTEQTHDTKPAAGFRLKRYRLEHLLADGGSGTELELYGPHLWRTAAGTDATFPAGGSVLITFVAGRWASTEKVDELYKEAARITLINLHQRKLVGTTGGRFEGEYDLPRYPFPAFDLPRAAEGLLMHARQDSHTIPGIA